jgi:UDP-N-acetylmuramyl tripeptide synthase
VRGAVATGAGKAVAFLSRRLRRGGGTTFPGYVARSIDPQLLQRLSARLAAGCVVVTGTNGKTTTSRMVANILRHAGLTPVHNRSGANLLDGVTTALLSSASLLGRLPANVGVFEVDEATLPQAAAETRPRVLVVTNLFRDQLDRYGEIDYVGGLWRQALGTLPPSSTAVLNADDPLVASLGAATAAQVLYFGIEDTGYALPELQHTADSRHCVACGAPYRYEAIHYSHLGLYACPRCGATRPAPAVYAREILLHGTDGSELGVRLPVGELSLRLGLPGLYNVSNALAALACCSALGVPTEVLQRGIETFTAAFGRIERIEIEGRQVLLALVKNPVGFDEVLRMLLLDGAPKDLVIVINDHIADGTDISWLWDVNFELLAGRANSVLVAGTRAEDMRLRLKYAGVDLGRVVLEKELHAALSRALDGVPAGGTLYVLPTYTAMLEVRQVIQEMGQVASFWED